MAGKAAAFNHLFMQENFYFFIHLQKKYRYTLRNCQLAIPLQFYAWPIPYTNL
jgi:hypothetical protein